MLPVDDSNVTKIVELSKESLDAFCDDISTMFEVEMTCEEKEVNVGSLKDIQKHFKKLAAVHTVEAEGTLNGTMQLVFDKSGLFTLAGVIVMLPPQRIIEETKRGTLENAQSMSDAVGEVGNLLTGTWDRVFRDELAGHKHFRKTATFLGDLWEDPSKVTGLVDADPFHTILYEITIESYPSFQCAALIPTVTTSADAATGTEESGEAVAVADPEQLLEKAVIEEDSPEANVSSDLESVSDTKMESELAESVDESGATETVSDEEMSAADAPAAEESAPEMAPEVAEDVSVSPEDRLPEREVADTTIQMEEAASSTPETVDMSQTKQAVSMPDVTGLEGLFKLTAGDIMSGDVVWVTPDNSVNDVLNTMQQHDIGYVMVGTERQLDGIVSKSNVLGALSPYLRPVFAKWRRPADDATLDIKVQWVMSRPVRTVRPSASLAVVVEQMRQFGGRCLPVADEAGRVKGLVTVFDILRVLSGDRSDTLQGKTPQAPCLMV
ncbi:CBS domain-containing protein [Planctomycetota bacterium]